MDWRVIAVNHTAADLRGATVTAQLHDLAGGQLGRTRPARLDVRRADTAEAFTTAWTDGLPDLHLLRLNLEDSRGRELSRNTYWRYREPAALRGLNKARQVRLAGAVTRASGTGDRRELTAVVRNQGSAVAAMVRLSLLEEPGGHRVLPTLYSDNYLWLLPGESRTVRLSWPADATSVRHPVLTAQAYHSPVATLRG